MNYDEINPVYYEKMYDSIPREMYMKEHWRPLIEKEIKKYCKEKNVLDLGCGTGIYTTVIKKYSDNVYGIDISRNWLHYIKNKKGISNILLADAHRIPLKNKAVDVIVTTGLFEYVSREVVIKEMNRVLLVDGFCIIAAPNKYSFIRIITKFIYKLTGNKYEKNEPSKNEMLRLFKNNGFDVIDYKMDDGLIWLPDYLDKLIGKKVYFSIEKSIRIFGENPGSNVMLFIVKKTSSI